MDTLIPIFIFFWRLFVHTLWIASTHGLLLLLFAFFLLSPISHLFLIYFSFISFCGRGREMERIKAQEFFVFVLLFCLKFLPFVLFIVTRAFRPIPVIFIHLLFFTEYLRLLYCNVSFDGHCWR